MNYTPRIAYSIEEFARLAGLGRTTVYQEIRNGRLRPLKVGKRTLVPADEARCWLARLGASHAQLPHRF
jgi:excisionase family DNA binding protein